VDRRSITRVLLQLGSQYRFQDVVEIAWQMGWEGDDTARLLGEILQSPDPALRTEAISLLEHSGTAAAPELNRIILALKDSDREVRYLAARSVEAIGTNTPQVIEALRSVLNDEHVIVRNVARRALTNFAPNTVLPASAGEAEKN
jgi:HEAT repeat protein